MPDEPNANQPDPAQAFQNALQRHQGDALKLASQLFDENFQLRNKNRDLTGKVPADGAVVLSKADAARWEAYTALGKKPEEIKAALDEHATSAQEVAKLKRRDTLRDVAHAHGYKLSVLEDLDSKTEGLEYVRKEEKDKQTGQTKVVYHVKAEGKETPLEQFAAENEKWRDYQPALKADGGQQPAKPGHRADPAPSGGPTSTLERVRQQEQERQKRAAPPQGSLKDRFFNRRLPAQS